jgi:hypothetical protein
MTQSKGLRMAASRSGTSPDPTVLLIVKVLLFEIATPRQVRARNDEGGKIELPLFL